MASTQRAKVELKLNGQTQARRYACSATPASRKHKALQKYQTKVLQDVFEPQNNTDECECAPGESVARCAQQVPGKALSGRERSWSALLLWLHIVFQLMSANSALRTALARRVCWQFGCMRTKDT